MTYRVYEVETVPTYRSTLVKTYKTLTSAKKYVERHTPHDWEEGQPYYRVSVMAETGERRWSYRYLPRYQEWGERY